MTVFLFVHCHSLCHSFFEISQLQINFSKHIIKLLKLSHSDCLYAKSFDLISFHHALTKVPTISMLNPSMSWFIVCGSSIVNLCRWNWRCATWSPSSSLTLSLLYLVSFFANSHVILLDTDGALLGTYFSLLLRETSWVILMVALEDYDRFWHFSIPHNWAHTSVANCMRLDQSPTTWPRIRCQTLIRLH